MPKNIFVYGTLMFPEIRQAIFGRDFDSEEAVLKNYKRYGVIGSNGREAFPGIKHEEDSETDGVLLYGVDEESLEKLDTLEGGEYKRQEVDVQVGNELVKAYVYVWCGGGDRELEGEWSKEDFEKEHLKYYLEEKIPRYLENL